MANAPVVYGMLVWGVKGGKAMDGKGRKEAAVRRANKGVRTWHEHGHTNGARVTKGWKQERARWAPYFLRFSCDYQRIIACWGACSAKKAAVGVFLAGYCVQWLSPGDFCVCNWRWR